MNAPDIKIKPERVEATSKGKITGPSWNANFGYSREKSIQEERQKEWDAFQERKAMEDPTMIRFLALEAAVKDLQLQVKELKDAKEL